MPVQKARRATPDGVIYRQQHVRGGKPGCRRCPPDGPGHGPYWYGFYWDYRQRTRSFYVGNSCRPASSPSRTRPLHRRLHAPRRRCPDDDPCGAIAAQLARSRTHSCVLSR